MDTWLLKVIALIIVSAVIAIFARIEDGKEKTRLEEGEKLSVDDFEILED